MGGKAQMRCLALRPPDTVSQIEYALNLEPILLVDVGHATVLVACRNVATRTAGGHTSVPTPYLWALPLEAKHSLLVGVSIGDAALPPTMWAAALQPQHCGEQCVTCPTGQEHPDASSSSGHLA